MNEPNNISEELKELQSHLGSLPRTMPYAVPAGYFASLAADALNAVQADDMDVTIQGWSKTNPHTIPENYFENLPDNVLAHVLSKDSNAAQQRITVPEGYFDSLPAQMLAAVKATEPLPAAQQQIPVRRRVVLRSIRWAAAAILLLGIGMTGYNVYLKEQMHTPVSLNSIPNQEISSYVQQNIDDFDADMLASNVATTSKNEPAVNQLNDKDIEQYLDATGWD